MACAIGFAQFICTHDRGRAGHCAVAGAHTARHARIAERRSGGGGRRHRSSPTAIGRGRCWELRRVEIEVPRARLNTPDGKTTEWKSKALAAYQRRHARCRRPDRGRLPGRHKHTPGAPRACGPVWRCGWQGHGQPVWRRVKSDWGRVERPARLPKTDRAAHSRRHSGARAGLTAKRLPSRSAVVLGIREDGRDPGSELDSP